MFKDHGEGHPYTGDSAAEDSHITVAAGTAATKTDCAPVAVGQPAEATIGRIRHSTVEARGPLPTIEVAAEASGPRVSVECG